MRYSKQKQKNELNFMLVESFGLEVNAEDAKEATDIIFDQVTAYTAGPSRRAV